MSSKLWPNMQNPTASRDYVLNDMRPGGCLVIANDDYFLERFNGIVIARKHYDAKVQRERVFAADKKGEAERTIAEILGQYRSRASKISAYEVFNEFETQPGVPCTGEALKPYVEFLLYAIDFADSAGVRLSVISASVGNPINIEGDWEILKPVVVAASKAGGAVSLHEYGKPEIWNPDRTRGDYPWGFYTLRYRRVADRLRRLGVTNFRFVITELGIDGLLSWPAGSNAVTSWPAESSVRQGWRKYCTAEQYRDQLEWYDREIQKDDYVIGACIFVCGVYDNSEWVDYNFDGEAAIAKYVRDNTPGPARWSVGPPAPVPPLPIPQPAPGVSTMTEAEFLRYCADIWQRAGVPYNPTSGLATYWREQFRTGRFFGFPQEQEHPTENQNYVVQAFSNMILYYDKQTGRVSEGLPPFA